MEFYRASARFVLDQSPWLCSVVHRSMPCFRQVDGPGGGSPRQRTRRRALPSGACTAFLLSLALSSSSRNAAADTSACVSAHSSGQLEAKAGRLKAAGELLSACSMSLKCPEQVREDCVRLFERTLDAMPSVILSVLDERGVEVTEAQVFSGEELVAAHLDGRAVDLDPGEHHLRFLLPDGRELKSDVVIREGEKNRLIQMQAPAQASPPEPVPPQDSLSQAASRPWAAWTAAGVAAAAVTAFGTFAYLGNRDRAELERCAPSCPRSMEPARDRLATSYLIADIALGAAVLSGAVAVYLFATHKGEEPPKAAAGNGRFRLDAPALSAGPGAAGLFLSGGFE